MALEFVKMNKNVSNTFLKMYLYKYLLPGLTQILVIYFQCLITFVDSFTSATPVIMKSEVKNVYNKP